MTIFWILLCFSEKYKVSSFWVWLLCCSRCCHTQFKKRQLCSTVEFTKNSPNMIRWVSERCKLSIYISLNLKWLERWKQQNNKIDHLYHLWSNKTLLTLVLVEDTCLVGLSSERTHCHHEDGSPEQRIFQPLDCPIGNLRYVRSKFILSLLDVTLEKWWMITNNINSGVGCGDTDPGVGRSRGWHPAPTHPWESEITYHNVTCVEL